MISGRTARTIVGIMGNVISLFLFASPVPTFYKIVKNKSVEEFRPDPYLATIMNCLLGVFYGLPMIRPDSLLVVTINGAGLVIEAIYCTLFFIYADKRGRIKLVIWILAEVAAMTIVVPCTLLLLHTHAKRSAVVGILMVIFLVLMYISPLTVMGKVIRTKSVKYMPFYLSLANFLNGVIWVTYALMEFDLYILIGNSLGALSGGAQLILYGCYFKLTPIDEDDDVLPSRVQLTSRN